MSGVCHAYLIMSYLPPSLPKKFLWFLGVFLEWKFRWKKCAVFWKLWENFFLAEKNPTSSFKIRGILGKKIQNPMGSRPFFPWKNVLWFLWKFTEIKFRWNKCAAIWKICEKHFFTGKKSDFKFQNGGILWPKKVLWFFGKFTEIKFRWN